MIVTIPSDIGKVIWPALLGYTLNWGLLGILSMQVYLYHMRYPKDSMHLKLAAFGIYMLECTQTILLTFDFFEMFAWGYGNVDAFDKVGMLWFSIPIMGGLAALVGQTFYAWRICVFTQAHSWLIAGVICLLSIVQLGGAIATGVLVKSIGVMGNLLRPDTRIAVVMWKSGSVLCDIAIASSMVYHLRKQRGGFKETEVILSKIIRLAVGTGIATATFDICTIIFMCLPGNPRYYQISSGMHGKVYSNSMLVVLNNRKQLSDDVVVAGRSSKTLEGEIVFGGPTLSSSVSPEEA